MSDILNIKHRLLILGFKHVSYDSRLKCFNFLYKQHQSWLDVSKVLKAAGFENFSIYREDLAVRIWL